MKSRHWYPGAPWFPETGRCVQNISSAAAHGFKWAAFDCAINDKRDQIACSMIGERISKVWVFSVVVPSACIITISFLSSCISVHQTMPRTAIAMIMMLTIITMRTQAEMDLPMGGEASWLEDYFQLAQVFMFINTAMHILAFRYDRLGMRARAAWVDDISFYGLFFLFPVFVFGSLSGKKCDRIEKDPFIWNVVHFSILLSGAISIVAMVILWRKYGAELAKEAKQAKLRAANSIEQEIGKHRGITFPPLHMSDSLARPGRFMRVKVDETVPNDEEQAFSDQGGTLDVLSALPNDSEEHSVTQPVGHRDSTTSNVMPRTSVTSSATYQAYV